MKDGHSFRYQLIVWEDRGGTERRRGEVVEGTPLASPLLTPLHLSFSAPAALGWPERDPPLPPPLARRHPATKYNTNSIKCSLRCDLTAMNDKLVVVLTL